MATHSNNFITGDAAFAVDKAGTIVLWNKEAEHLLGYSAAEALDQRCWQLLAGHDIHDNRYCCENCPLREMVSRHESVHGFPLKLHTAYEGQKQIPLSFLEVFDQSGRGLLLHICHEPEDASESPPHYHSPADQSGGHHRNLLTQRELEVLELLAEGKSTREIASTLSVSRATVRNHVQHTLNKLQAHNRLEAVIKGQRLNLI